MPAYALNLALIGRVFASMVLAVVIGVRIKPANIAPFSKIRNFYLLGH